MCAECRGGAAVANEDDSLVFVRGSGISSNQLVPAESTFECAKSEAAPCKNNAQREDHKGGRNDPLGNPHLLWTAWRCLTDRA